MLVLLDPGATQREATTHAIRGGPQGRSGSDPTSEMGTMINIANVQRVDWARRPAIVAGAKAVMRPLLGSIVLRSAIAYVSEGYWSRSMLHSE